MLDHVTRSALLLACCLVTRADGVDAAGERHHVDPSHRRASTRMVTFSERVLPQVSKETEVDDLHRLTRLGALSTVGYHSMRLSVAGRFGSVQGEDPVELELVFVPAVSYVRQRWSKENRLLLAQHLVVPLRPVGKDLFEGRAELEFHFARYNVYVRNRARGKLNVVFYMLLLD